MATLAIICLVMASQLKSIVIDDVLISYRDSGSGQILLCLHGWQSDNSSFEAIAGELKEYRIIAPDLPNFGKSEETDKFVELNDFAGFVKKFVEKLEIKDYVIIGHSMGGQIAVRATAKKLISPRRLVLIGASGIRNEKRATKQLMRLAAKATKKITPAKIKDSIYGAVGSDYSSDLSNIHKKIIASMLSSDIQQDAQVVSQPVLLIYGAKDTATPPSHGELLANKLQRADLQIIAAGDHWVHVIKAPVVSSHIKEFLSNGSTT